MGEDATGGDETLDAARGLASTAAGGPAPRTDPHAQTPAEMGRYLRLGLLGQGGMGVVYAAYDPDLDRKVAIKLLRGRTGDAAARARLLREAQSLAKLSHPNVVHVYDVGELHSGEVYVAMELVEGQTLRAHLHARRLGWREKIGLFCAAGRGLAAAHAIGLVHRDFKPDNVLVAADGGVRVADFGLARVARSGDASGLPVDDDARSGRIDQVTADDAVVGTPAYMAPEQFAGGVVDARTDQFAFCVALREALYDEHPFGRATVSALAVAVREGRLRPPPPGSDVPARIERALARGLAVDPAARFPDLQALLDELARDPWVARRRWATAAAVVGLVVAVPWVVRPWAADAKCEGAPARFAEVWDGRRADALRAAFGATGRSYAASAADDLVAGLDGYGTQWADAHREACVATHVVGEQSTELLDLRVACLNDRRAAVAELVSVMEGDAVSSIDRVDRALASLPELAPCSDAVGLRLRMPAPGDAIADEVAAVRAVIARSEAAREAGRHALALEAGTLARRRAEAIDYPVVLAEARLAEGTAAESVGDYATAEASLRAAATDALAIDHVACFAEAATWLVWIWGDARTDLAEARDWADLAAAALRRSSDDRLAARLASNLGVALMNAGQYDAAVVELERAVALATSSFGRDHERTLAARGNLVTAKFFHGRRFAEALEGYREIEAASAARLGERHPTTLVVRSSVVSALERLGDLATAETTARSLVADQERELGPDHPDLAYSLHHLGAVLSSKGDREEAATFLDRAYELWRRLHGDDSVQVARALHAMAMNERALGRLAAARTHAERSLAIVTKVLGAEHPDRVVALYEVSLVARLQGEHGVAKQRALEAVELARKLFGEQHQRYVLSLVAVGNAELAAGDAEAAVQTLRRAESSAVAMGEQGARDLALVRGDLVTAELAAKKSATVTSP